ncbi:hypothetical protein FACS189476_00440 [Spirochaetia bacterium]|nr:hypothetical protein FACS189476_00440 [Spirochaetia bacterium]
MLLATLAQYRRCLYAKQEIPSFGQVLKGRRVVCPPPPKCGRTLRVLAVLIAAIAVLTLGGCDLINPESEPEAAPDRTAPAEVSGLTATPGNAQVVLTWNDPLDSDFRNVTITQHVRLPSGNVAVLQLESVRKGTQTRTFTGLTNGTDYTFTVKTVDKADNSSAGTSVTVTPVDPSIVSVSGVTVSPASASVEKGKSQQFTASVTGINNPAQTVSWSILEAGRKRGTTIGVNGLLTVAPDEILTDLTVQATSTVDNTKSGTESVTVVPDATAPEGVGNLNATAGDTRVILTWTDPADWDFKNVVITYMNGTAQSVTVPKGTQTAVISGLINGTLYTFTVKTVDTTGNISDGNTIAEHPTSYDGSIFDLSSSDLTIKFGRRANPDVPLTQSMVSLTFGDLHGLINDTGADFTTIIAPGDYIDLPSLTIAGYGTIYDKDLGTPGGTNYHGRLLRLRVVGINLFNGINGNSTPHVVFQFQNIPVNHTMNPTMNNAGGYAASGMRSFLTGAFLTGLKAVTGLDDMLWGPRRLVANGGINATGTNMIDDTLWLPTLWEMTGISGISSSAPREPPGTSQVQLQYNGSTKIKYNNNNTAISYWLASPQGYYSWKLINSVGATTINEADVINKGCVPAFCVK